MKVGIIGLGKMGLAIAHRLIKRGLLLWGYDPAVPASLILNEGIQPALSIQHLLEMTQVVWLMIPAGKPVDGALEEVIRYKKENLIVVDGGNSFFEDSIARSARLQEHNILLLDCGTSGGVQGKEKGFCLMIGGDKNAYNTLEPLFAAIAAPNGYAHVGPSGAGHYIKMIHNGIEYSLLHAYAEGFALLQAQQRYPLIDLAKITALWNQGSVIRSWLLELLQRVFEEHGQQLESISGTIAQGGTGLWTLQEAQRANIPMPLLNHALQLRDLSRQPDNDDYANKLVALIRNQFGAHAFLKKEIIKESISENY